MKGKTSNMKIFFGSMVIWAVLLGAVVVSARADGFGGRAPSGDASVDEILRKSTQNVYSGSEESLYVMKLNDNGSETSRKMKVLYKRGGPESAKLLIKFLEPADIRGTALLSVIEKDKPADQWIYLPALKKTRRIKGGNENESFLGSDFTVGDLTSVDNDAQRYDYKVTDASAPCGDAKCYVLTGAPKGSVDASSLSYSKKVLKVRRDNYVTERVEFYDPEGKLEKTLELQKIHQAGPGNWLSDRMEMKNLLTGHSTVIEVSKRDASRTPPDSAFTQAALERN